VIVFGKRLAGLSETALARFVKRAARSAGLRGQINILITGNEQLRRLNWRFRKKNEPTDVLSFPPLAEAGKSLAGDIAISADIAAQNARFLNHSTQDEIKILTLHGMLHLAGYDHERDNGTMARQEERLRQSLGLPTGLIGRNGRTGAAGRLGLPHDQEARRRSRPARSRKL